MLKTADAKAGTPYPACNGWDSWPDDALKHLNKTVALDRAWTLGALDALTAQDHPGGHELTQTDKYKRWRAGAAAELSTDDGVRAFLVAQEWRSEREDDRHGGITPYSLQFKADGSVLLNEGKKSTSGTWTSTGRDVELTFSGKTRTANLRDGIIDRLLDVPEVPTLQPGPYTAECWNAF